MRLAALFLERDPTRDAASFAGDDQAVTDYLVGEVLASQPADMQRFLLRTSVAERLSSGLAEALTDASHGQQRLEALESSNAFVVGLGPGREWFRYHALLREVLRHRLGVEDPGALPDLHRRAAHWFAGNGRPIEAMRHAADAEDWPLLGRIFVTTRAALVVSADRTAVERVLTASPGTGWTTARTCSCVRPPGSSSRGVSRTCIHTSSAPRTSCGCAGSRRTAAHT